MKQDKVLEVLRILDLEFPDPKPPLNHTNAFDLLVAVILSAQCTDARVNLVTPNLFPQYDTPEKMLELGEEGLKETIKSCGFYNSKGRNIISMCMDLIEKHNGEVPNTLEELTKLAGVGVKTASVVLSQWFKIPAVPVDTHVHRIANRLGLCKTKTPEKTEAALRKVMPKETWIDGHLQIVFHGRKTCFARKPRCGDCPLSQLCEWKEKERYV